jgi:copper(I)-binding protein
MEQNRMRTTAVLCLALTLVAGAATAAEGIRLGDLVIYDPWARASAGAASNGAAYVAIHNHGAADRLLAASTPAAARSELHSHLMVGDVMEMRPAGPIDIHANGRVRLEPGGTHVMLMGLTAPLKEGATFPLTLRFEKAGEITLTVSVLKVGDKGPADPHRDHQAGHERLRRHEHQQPAGQPQQRP